MPELPVSALPPAVDVDCPLLRAIGRQHRVRVRPDACGDLIIPGKNGHLYTHEPQESAVMVMFTDDGRAKPFTRYFRNKRFAKLKPYIARVTQDGDYEFTCEINPTPEALKVALFEVLGVKRFKTTRGVPRPPEIQALLRHQGQKRRLEAIARRGGMVEYPPGPGDRKSGVW